MVEKTLNLLKAQKKSSIILITLSILTGVLLWKARWMLYLFMKLVSIMLFLYQTELHLIGSILIISITVLNISKISKRSYSPQIAMRLVRILSRSLYVVLGRKYAGWQISVFIKMLMISLLLTGVTLYLMLYTLPLLSRLKM